ncbi:hypothetical protein DPMN_108256 [Dreissena polymorpha]|uniref:Uncharacterized protein n=1 Tax=Dreissena polymorpha TaxID=45954 RepID=A0A9D4K892_DREPO|nr:hypothetical protein DPMN_108256 [Dreissena polymorpha]
MLKCQLLLEQICCESIGENFKCRVGSFPSPIEGQVKATKTVIPHPLETKTIAGFVRKSDLIEAAVTETGDLHTAFSVCPREVSLKNHGKTARIPVRVCNLSAKTIKIESKSVLCNLEEVKVLRSVNLCENSYAENEEVNVCSIQFKTTNHIVTSGLILRSQS